MRRLFVVITAIVLTGVGLAAWGTVASAREAGLSELERAQQKLPPLPADIKARKRFNIAVKCDSPPFGYIGARSQHAGFDVDIARWFSRFAFGKSNRVTYTCVTTPAREPALTTGRVDMVIATFT
jgi:polar amino acid transport system substrate-binding protein